MSPLRDLVLMRGVPVYVYRAWPRQRAGVEAADVLPERVWARVVAAYERPEAIA